MEIFEVPFFDDDIYKMMFRFTLNLIVITIIIHHMYYKTTRRKDYLFTYYLISMVVFFLTFTLKKYQMDIGMALGLFAVFGIIRYRTEPIATKEMTFLFVVIGMSIINALANKKVSYIELFATNGIILITMFILESGKVLGNQCSQRIVYEKIDNIRPENYDALKADLEERTGLEISRIDIDNINFLKDTAKVTIFYDGNQFPKGDTQ